MLRKLLIVCSGNFRIVDPLTREFRPLGVDTAWLDYHRNHWFDRYVIHTLNKQAHNLRLLPKDKALFRDHPLSHLHYRGRRLLEAVEAFAPDLVLMVRGPRFTREVLEAVAARATLFGWYIEAEEWARDVRGEIDLFDRYFFISPANVEEYRSLGFDRAKVMRHSVDTGAFHPLDVPKRYDWCFVGSWSARRQELIEQAFEVSADGALFGPNWRKRNRWNRGIRRLVKGDYVSGRALAELYGATRVVLNVTAWGHGGGSQRSGVNTRILEVPACRAVLLTDGSADLASVATPGEHVIVYRTDAEFRLKLAQLLQDPMLRERIAEAGYRHVATNFSYADIARQLKRCFEQCAGDGEARVGRHRAG